MTDLRKPSLDLLYELIEQANPGFTAKFPPGTISFGTPANDSSGGGFTNTRIPFRSKSGGTTIGSGRVYYRRLDFAVLFKNMRPTISTWRNYTSMPAAEFLPLFNQAYGLNLTQADIRQSNWPADAAGYLQATDASLCYRGIVNVYWVRGKQPLDQLVTADKQALAGRTFPSSIATYDQFLAWMVTAYGSNSQTTGGFLAQANTGAIGSGYFCVDSALPVYGDPVGDFVRYDSGMAGVIRMLMGDPAVADENFASRRRIGLVYEATQQRQSFASVTRGGVTSQSSGAGSGNAIRSLFWWDEINRRAMQWNLPRVAGTKANPYRGRIPSAEERPRGDLIGYAGDYSKWASKLSGTISWQEVADAMKEVTGLPFNMSDYSVPFGLNNIPGGNFPRYTLPTASVPEANSAKFNRVVLVTAPDANAWWTGRFFLHYNI